jgi:AcrR family transcriptional regulator
MTTAALAQEVGISHACVFRHFPNKGAIWNAVGRYIGKLLAVKTTLSDKSDIRPIDQLRELVIAHLTFIEATPAIPAILFSRELHSENDKLRAFFEGLITSRHQYFSNLVADEIETGRFRPDIEPEDAAYLMLSLVQGLAMRWSLNARNFCLADEGRRLLELQLSGFKTINRSVEP